RGIGDVRHDNGDRAGRPLGCDGSCRRSGDDDINSQTYQLIREVVEAFEAPVRRAELDHDILTLHVVEVAKAFLEASISALRGDEDKKSYPGDLSRLLRPGCPRHGEHAAPHHRYERSALHA